LENSEANINDELKIYLLEIGFKESEINGDKEELCNKIIKEMSISDINNENTSIEEISEFYSKKYHNSYGKNNEGYVEDEGINILSISGIIYSKEDDGNGGFHINIPQISKVLNYPGYVYVDKYNNPNGYLNSNIVMGTEKKLTKDSKMNERILDSIVNDKLSDQLDKLEEHLHKYRKIQSDSYKTEKEKKKKKNKSQKKMIDELVNNENRWIINFLKTNINNEFDENINKKMDILFNLYSFIKYIESKGTIINDNGIEIIEINKEIRKDEKLFFLLRYLTQF